MTPLIIAGILATILGTLLLGPLAIRLFARPAGHTPIAVRLALRDLARYQARSGAALAAITLALGIAAAVVVVAAAEERKADAAPPNLSDRQIRVYTGLREQEVLAVQTPAELERMAARVRQLAADLDDAAVIPLHNAVRQGVEPGVTSDGIRVISTEVLTRKIDDPESGRWSREGNDLPGRGALLCHRIAALRRHARPARIPRDRPRGGRSEHGLPGRPGRPDRRARHSRHDARRRGPKLPRMRSRTSRGSTAGSSSALRSREPALRPTRSSRSTVFAAAAGNRPRPAGSSSRAGP